MDLEILLKGIPSAATSTLALAAYLAAIVAWLVIALKVKRNRQLLEHLEKLPPKDRIKAFSLEVQGVTLNSGITPDQWLKSKIHQYFFISFLTICAVFVIVFSMTLFVGDDVTPVSNEAKLKALELGHSLEYVKDEIDAHISYKNGDGNTDTLSDVFYVNEKMNSIRLLEYLGFDRNDELSMLRTKSLSQWEGTNEAWELISRVEGYLEKKSKILFYIYKISFIAGRIHATIQEKPAEDISKWHAELVDYVNRLKEIDKTFSELELLSLKNIDNDVRYVEFVDKIRDTLEQLTNT